MNNIFRKTNVALLGLLATTATGFLVSNQRTVWANDSTCANEIGANLGAGPLRYAWTWHHCANFAPWCCDYAWHEYYDAAGVYRGDRGYLTHESANSDCNRPASPVNGHKQTFCGPLATT